MLINTDIIIFRGIFTPIDSIYIRVFSRYLNTFINAETVVVAENVYRPGFGLVRKCSCCLNHDIISVKCFSSMCQRLTVSAAVRLMPSPPARVLSRKTKISVLWRAQREGGGTRSEYSITNCGYSTNIHISWHHIKLQCK